MQIGSPIDPFEYVAHERGDVVNIEAGVVLTGGGSLIKGTAELAREVLGMHVKIGIPSGFNAGLVREISNPIFATSVGLVLYALKNKERSAMTFENGSNGKSGKSIFSKMKSWFDEL